MNTIQETERLQNALAGLVTTLTKMVSERVEQALVESLPVKLPAITTGNAADRRASDRLLTKRQVAELLNVTPRSIDNWMKRGLLPYLKIGRSVRFNASNVIRHLDETALVDRAGTARYGLAGLRNSETS